MPIVVQKFGGTSVATADRVRTAAQRSIATQKDGNQVVVVVSAQGQMTDELIAMGREISPHPPRRELDVLISTGEQISIALFAMAVHEMGHKAISFTAAQVGILTDSSHTRARILKVKADRILEELNNGNIVIVAGFQGVDEKNNITTLGRGGSDTTAVALAAALKADLCEIYTDVDGVFTADPRIVPAARRLAVISHDEMMEMASLGAGVLHLRSVEFAKNFNVKLVVRSSLNDREGTLVCEETPAMERVMVRGCAISKEEALISVEHVPSKPGALPKFFEALADNGINIDMIVQSARGKNSTDVSFTVNRDDLFDAVQLTKQVAKSVGAQRVTSNRGVAKVSVVGIGMRSQPGVAAKVFGTLGRKNIRMYMITTSEIKISCLVDEEKGEEALKAIHEAFKLGKTSGDLVR